VQSPIKLSLVRTLTLLVPIAFWSSVATAQSANPLAPKAFEVPTTLDTLLAVSAGNKKAFRCDALEHETYAHTEYRWQDVRPLEYLSYLSSHSANAVTVSGCKEGWVKEEDVPLLLDLLDSKESCPNQKSVKSSFWSEERSTVGNEAAWLIQAFRVGRFPPGLNSTNNGPDPAELRRWWQERKERSSAQPRGELP